MERLPVLKLDCFMYKYKSLQAGQLPRKQLCCLQKLLNFIITKYLKQEVDNELSICMDEHSPCSLSTEDIKIYKNQGRVSISIEFFLIRLGILVTMVNISLIWFCCSMNCFCWDFILSEMLWMDAA